MQYQKIQKQVGLAGAICGSLVIGLPAIAMPRIEMRQLLSQTNPNPSIFKEAPYNRGSSTSPLNPNPSILQEAPYNRRSTSPSQDGASPPVVQPPLPEQQQAPSAVVTPKNGTVSVTLINETGANINYQVIGNTNQRSLRGKSNVLLQNLRTPVTVTFQRQDKGLLKVTPQASSEPGMLEVRFTETTDLGTDRSTMRIQNTGAVLLN